MLLDIAGLLVISGILLLIIGIFIVGSLFIGLCWGGETMLYFMNQFNIAIPYMAILAGFAFIGDIFILKKRN